ncbi:MAG: NAD(P)H-dependent oxidoreductase [Cyclobacteriaceae bacterium]
MPHIAIISASVRTGRKSYRVALYFENFLKSQSLATVEILDLNVYQFPVFTERLKHQPSPSPDVIDFAEKIKKADGVLIVTPEYNGGYPASIKNVIDLLYPEWFRKPIAITTVSDGSFGGSQVITSLVFTLWKIRAWVIPAMFPVPNVEASFSEDGHPVKSSTDDRAKIFVDEFLWCIRAKSKMDKL